jgi:hypothetical protein
MIVGGATLGEERGAGIIARVHQEFGNAGAAQRSGQTVMIEVMVGDHDALHVRQLVT